MDMPSGVDLHICDHVAALTLNRPETANAIDHDLHIEIPKILAALRRDGDVRVVVLGAVGKVFSGGGDLGYIEKLANDRDYRENILDITRALYQSFSDFSKPIIAAVQGDAVGVGATIAASCDIIVAAKSVRFIDPHVRVGLGAGDGGVPSWAASIGLLRAKRHLLTGDPLHADMAFQLGLVTDLVDEPGDVQPTAMKLAAKIAGLHPQAVQGTKRAFNQYIKDVGEGAFQVSVVHEVACLETEDIHEALAAAKEKRAPRFKGK